MDLKTIHLVLCHFQVYFERVVISPETKENILWACHDDKVGRRVSLDGTRPSLKFLRYSSGKDLLVMFIIGWAYSINRLNVAHVRFEKTGTL